jgi:type I restriction enzyme S subunit
VRFPVVPLKHLSALPITNGVGEAAEFDDPGWPRYVRTTDIAGPRSLRADTFKSLPPEIARKAQLRRGDIIMTAAGATIGKSSLYMGETAACYAGYLVRFRAGDDIDARFVGYWMESQHYWDQIETGKVVSTIENFSAGKYRNLRCPVPEGQGQRAIADFLDAETERIDSLIAKKRQMVTLLAERSRRTVGELTRRGVDRGVPTIDSGLPWVGEIPAHWSVVPNKSVMRFARRTVTPGEEPTLLSLTKRGVIVRDTSDNEGKFPSSFGTYQVVEPDQLVFCLFDVPETPRTVGIATETGMVTGAYAVAITRQGVNANYVRLLYEGYDDEKSLSLFYTGLRNVIRPDTFLRMPMPLPPLHEQEAIVRHLSAITERHQEAIHALSQQVDILRERRQALITAAVTGELDIPGVAA